MELPENFIDVIKNMSEEEVIEYRMKLNYQLMEEKGFTKEENKKLFMETRWLLSKFNGICLKYGKNEVVKRKEIVKLEEKIKNSNENQIAQLKYLKKQKEMQLTSITNAKLSELNDLLLVQLAKLNETFKTLGF